MHKLWITKGGRKITLITDYFNGWKWYAVIAERGLDKYLAYTDILGEFNNIYTRNQQRALNTVMELLHGPYSKQL